MPETRAVQQAAALGRRHIAEAAESLHHLLLLVRREAAVLRENVAQVLALRRRKASHNFLPLFQHLPLLRGKVVPSLQILPDLLLPPAGKAMELRVIAKNFVLLLGGQIPQPLEEIRSVLMGVPLDTRAPPNLAVAHRFCNPGRPEPAVLRPDGSGKTKEE